MIAILGGSGFAAGYFRRRFMKRGEAGECLSRSQVDYANKTKLVAYLENRKPKFLINAEGYTGKPNVDACEMHI